MLLKNKWESYNAASMTRGHSLVLETRVRLNILAGVEESIYFKVITISDLNFWLLSENIQDSMLGAIHE